MSNSICTCFRNACVIVVTGYACMLCVHMHTHTHTCHRVRRERKVLTSVEARFSKELDVGSLATRLKDCVILSVSLNPQQCQNLLIPRSPPKTSSRRTKNSSNILSQKITTVATPGLVTSSQPISSQEQ